jgi:hypothetical protein
MSTSPISSENCVSLLNWSFKETNKNVLNKEFINGITNILDTFFKTYFYLHKKVLKNGRESNIKRNNANPFFVSYESNNDLNL